MLRRLMVPILLVFAIKDLRTLKLLLMKHTDLFFVGSVREKIPGVTTLIISCTVWHFCGSFPLKRKHGLQPILCSD
jgi:hypothetical protein